MSALGGKSKKSHRRKSHRGGAPGVAESAAEYQGVESAANMAGDPPKPDGGVPPPASGGMASAFEVGAMTGMSGGRRRRRRSNKHRGSKSRRRGSRRSSRRRQSKRGGALSYSEF